MNAPRCRSCGGRDLQTVLDLGRTPLANSLLDASNVARPEKTYPLELGFCPACSLVQIYETVPPEQLFSEYVYFSSFSDTMVEHSRVLAERLIGSLGLKDDSLVVEAASNDGYLLQHYRNAGVPVLGVEPARNIASAANAKGIRTRCEFFTEAFAGQLRSEGLQADVFHANNVLAHVPDLNGFV